MRKFLLCLSFLAATATTAAAETWIAICTDGQNLQYNQTVGGNGFLYLKGTQVARLEQTFFNGTAICGTVPGNGTGSPATGSNPITQLCANRSRNIGNRIETSREATRALVEGPFALKGVRR